MKNNKSGKILNVLLGVIAVFIIIFVIAWLVNRGGKNTNTADFANNLDTMQTAAKEYFVNDLPSEVGDSITLTLEELYELGLIDELTYNNESCSTDDSYVSITKINSTEYKVKSNLVCGDKKDSITEKIEGSIKIEDEDGTVIMDSDDENTTIETTEGTTTTKDGKKTTTVTTKDCTVDVDCEVTRTEMICTTIYENQFVRRNVSCPTGYTLSNGSCIKTSTDTKEASAVYTGPISMHEEAKENVGGYYKVYTDSVKTEGTTSYYCNEGTLSGNKCIIYKDKNSSDGCPSGYTLSGNTCYKYASKTSSTTCSSGYTLSNGKCYKYASKNTSTTYYCPSGYTASGSGSSMKCYKTSSVTTSCPSGYTEKNGTCYAYTNPTSTTTTTCPTGYTKSGSTCVKTSTASKAYTAWGNPYSTYQSSTKESTYTNELTKKVQTGESCKKVAGKSICTYSYALYKRSAYYTCASGTLNGTLCYTYANPTSSTSYSCPSGYTKSGSTCYKTASKTSTCTSGTKSGNLCYTYTNRLTKTTSSCPSGYTDNGSNCYVTASATTTYSCPSGYTDNGSNCVSKVSKTTSYSCPSGYSDNGSNCKKTVSASTRTTDATYSCPSGYTAEGTGSSLKCYVQKQSDSTYYCEKADATLIGKTCYYTTEGKITGYECPSGYTLSGTTCYKNTTETTSAIWSNAEYRYSESSYLEGYQRTGGMKYTTTCEKVTESEEIHYK